MVREHVVEQRKLRPGEVDDLVTRYQAGASQPELGARYGIHRQTVRRYLVKRGVTLRPQHTLANWEEREAVRLYVEHTQTLSEIATRLGVSPNTVRSVLVKRKVERRAQARRRRRY